MHPIEAEKQRQYKWWLDVFLPAKLRQGSRDERYRLGILVIAMLGIFLSGLIFFVQSLSIPISKVGMICATMLPLAAVIILLNVRWKGQYRRAALYFGVFGTPFVVGYLLALKTVHIGFFYWIPWVIVFVSFLGGRRQGLLMGLLTLLQTLVVLHWNGKYGHSFGVYGSFGKLFAFYLENQVLSMLALSAMMYTFSLYNDRMEQELERQHVSRAQTAHKAVIGEMLGNLAHEVNNPLAIVHTALIHYQRLLQTQRLDKSMQRGLIQRMEDALDRLRNVVADLNSSSEWSDLEVPRSYASMQSDQDRPPQFGNSLLTASSENTIAEARSSHFWINRWMRRALSLLDKTLPKVTKTWSTSQRFRARTTALICCVGLVATVSSVLQIYLTDTEGLLLVSAHLFLGFAILSMLVLKISTKPQIMGAGYILLLFLMTCYISLNYARTMANSGLHWFPLMIIGLFLVARPKPALVLALLIQLGNFLMMIGLGGQGLEISFGQTFPQYLERLHATLILSNLTVMILSAAFISLMNSTHSMLVAEKDWHLLSARMRELSELADSAAILIGEPLKQLDQMLKDLRTDGQNQELLQLMQKAVARIHRVSQSFTLLSRPKTNESMQTIEGSIWMEHIHNICLRRAASAGWKLSTRVEPDDMIIEGHLGRLTMLLITCLQEGFGHRAPQKESPLDLLVSRQGDEISLRIQYQATPHSNAPPDRKLELEKAMRLSLLRELLESLQADLQRTETAEMITLEVRWSPQQESLRP